MSEPTWGEIARRALMVTRAQAITPLRETFAAKRQALTAAEVQWRHDQRERKALILPPSPFWLDGNPAYVTDDDKPLAGLGTYAVSALAYVCADFRATKLTEAPLWIVDETDDGEEWLPGSHPLEALLEQPNPDMDAGEFWHLVSLYLDLPGGGECLLLKTRDRAGRVVSLYPYARGEFEAKPAAGRLYGEFRVSHLGGNSKPYGPDDVIYLREVDPRGPFSALSPGDAALADLNLSEQQRAAVRATFRLSINPGAVITTDQLLGKEEFDRMKAEVTASYGGAMNHGKPMLLEIAKFEQMKNSLKELDFGPLSDRIEAVVCAAYKVHPVLVGLHAGAEMNGGLSDSLEPAQALFYDLCALPRWKRIGAKLTQGLLRGAGGTDAGNLRRYLRFDTTAVRALQEDTGAKIEAASKATWLTTNEKRAYTGWEPTDAPEDDELQRAPAPGTGEPADDDDAPRLQVVKARRQPQTKQWTPERMAAAWAEFDTKAAAEEDGYERAALAQFRAEKAAVVRLIEQAVPDGFKAAPPAPETKAPDDPPDYTAPLIAPYLEGAVLQLAAEYAPGGDFHAEWVKRFVRLIGATLVDGGRQVAGAVGIRFGLDDPLAVAAVERRARELATLVGEETAERVTRVVADARRDGLSMRKVVAAIRAEFDDMTPTRATRIARTETVGALNEGRKVGAHVSGMRAKRWGSQKVGDVRRNHVQWDNEGWKPIDYAYPGGAGMQMPGDRAGGAKEVIHCRCFMLYDDRTPDEIAADGDE